MRSIIQLNDLTNVLHRLVETALCHSFRLVFVDTEHRA